MGGRGRSSGAGRAGGGSTRTTRGGGFAAGGSGGGSLPAGDHSDQDLREEVARSVDRIPLSLRKMLALRGVALQVQNNRVQASQGRRGSYNNSTKTARVYIESFKHLHGPQNAGMTALHELGHAVDYQKSPGSRISAGKSFRDALAKDQKLLQNRRLSAHQRRGLTYQHYPVGQRTGEIFAEGFAIAHGRGRPGPGRAGEWNNSRLFQKVYPNVMKVIRGIK